MPNKTILIAWINYSSMHNVSIIGLEFIRSPLPDCLVANWELIKLMSRGVCVSFQRIIHFDETVSIAFNRTNRIRLNCMLLVSVSVQVACCPKTPRCVCVCNLFIYRSTKYVCLLLCAYWIVVVLPFDAAHHRHTQHTTICKFYAWFESLIKINWIYLVSSSPFDNMLSPIYILQSFIVGVVESIRLI